MAYDAIHNITSKQQAATLDGRTDLKSTYTWAYTYRDNGETKPHAPTHIGTRSYTYDANGNQTGFSDDNTGSRRTGCIPYL